MRGGGEYCLSTPRVAVFVFSPWLRAVAREGEERTHVYRIVSGIVTSPCQYRSASMTRSAVSGSERMRTVQFSPGWAS